MESILSEFTKAADAIDAKFGAGYAKEHPELIAALLKTAQSPGSVEVCVKNTTEQNIVVD